MLVTSVNMSTIILSAYFKPKCYNEHLKQTSTLHVVPYVRARHTFQKSKEMKMNPKQTFNILLWLSRCVRVLKRGTASELHLLFCNAEGNSYRMNTRGMRKWSATAKIM